MGASKERRDYQKALFARYERMADACRRLSSEDMADLQAWEDEHLGTYDENGELYGTLDWPRWPEFCDMSVSVPKPEPRRSPKPKTSIPPDLRWEVWERDNFTCRMCGVRRHLRVDHIIPESKGGPTELDNLQTLCRTCNSKKGTQIIEC